MKTTTTTQTNEGNEKEVTHVTHTADEVVITNEKKKRVHV